MVGAEAGRLVECCPGRNQGADWYRKRRDAGRRQEKGRRHQFRGQMHGLVILDAEDRVIRPAILWNDGRTVKRNGIFK